MLNIVETVEFKGALKRRDAATPGVDLMFCLGISGKVWARCCCKVARDMPVAIDLMRSMEDTPELQETTNTNDNVEEIAIEPSVSVFCYDDCVL